MIKHFFSLLILTIFFGCSPIKKINSNVISGEFDKAINKTISELKKTKNKKKIIQYESILLDIYNRSVVSSKDIIGRLKKDGNPGFKSNRYGYSNRKVDNWIKKHGVRYFNELTNMAQLTRKTLKIKGLLILKNVFVFQENIMT